jgi:transposase-like protein
VKLFCAELTATKIAVLTPLHRNPLHSLGARTRVRLVLLADPESAFKAGELELAEASFGARRVRGQRGARRGGKTSVFGLKKRAGKGSTSIVKNGSARELVLRIKRLAPTASTLDADEGKADAGWVNRGAQAPDRVKPGAAVFANGRAQVNGLENFWGRANTRLAKFRGCSAPHCSKHLKETAFRFNHRQDNLDRLRLTQFRKKPL